MKTRKTSIRSRARIRLLPALLLGALALGAKAETTQTWVAAARAHEARDAVHIGPLRAGEQVHVVLALKLRNKPQLDELTANLMAGKGAKPLGSAEFLDRHAPTAAQAQRVVDYLRRQGFTNIEVASNRLLVEADGTAGAVRTAFQTDLHEYEVEGRRAYANVTDAFVPGDLSDVVLAVGGLQTVNVAHPMLVKAQAALAKPAATLQTSISEQYINPKDFAGIYGASSLPSATSATIGIITVGTLAQSITDLRAFATSAGYPQPTVTTTVIGSASSDTKGYEEWDLDTQTSLAAAGGTIRSMILYNINNWSDGALMGGYNRAMSDNKAKVINVSIAECENNVRGYLETSMDQIFQSAVAQGQTFSVASGDSGGYECGPTGGFAQSYPAVSPYVMAIGGTTLGTTQTTPPTYGGETAWSCTSAALCQQPQQGDPPGKSTGGAGGGPSLTEAAPAWQVNANVLSSSMRGVPDISFDANPGSGAWVREGSSQWPIGGTSLAAPIFTGFWSRIQSANGNTLPFPAPTLYQGAATHPNWFHDVLTGNQGYSAHAGWDNATGYGSLQIANFATAFGSGGTPPPVSISFPSGATASSMSSPYYDPSATLTLNANGSASVGGYVGDGFGSTSSSPTISIWATNAPTVNGSRVDVLATQIGGNTSASGPLGSWMNLGAAQAWTVNAYHANGCDTWYYAQLQLQFRDSTSHAILATDSVTIETECNSSLGN